jgi:hypothetical protein
MIRIKSELKKRDNVIIELESMIRNIRTSNDNLFEENKSLKEKVDRFGQIFTFVKRKSSKPIFDSEKSVDSSRDLLELSKNRTQSAHDMINSHKLPPKDDNKNALSMSYNTNDNNLEIKQSARDISNTRYSKYL